MTTGTAARECCMASRWLVACGLVAPLLGACGGGSDDESATPAYAFSPPPLNSVLRYAETVTDGPSTSTLEQTEAVTAVNADGSFTEVVVLSVVSGPGSAPPIPIQTVSFNNSGQLTSESETDAAGSSGTCTFTPHGGGPDYPIAVGDTWKLSYSESCGNSAPIDYTESGSVVDLETVIVPAGSFTALKVEYTDTYVAGTVEQTQTATYWVDAATAIMVKSTVSTVFSGGPAGASSVTQVSTSELQSLP